MSIDISNLYRNRPRYLNYIWLLTDDDDGLVPTSVVCVCCYGPLRQIKLMYVAYVD